jgi:gag-polyprotein putative aspartyl protease
MKYLCLLLAAVRILAAGSPENLEFTRQGHAIILKDVFLNHQGPYRMVVDTGNASSLVRPEVARRLRLTPAYAVERVTEAGTHLVPAAILDEVRTGSVSQPAVEVMIDRVPLPGADGVLGQSWLIRHDYLLDYAARRLVLDAEAPRTGNRYGLRNVEGRPAIAAQVNGSRRELVLDSGAELMVLSPGAGLLPLHELSSVYVSNREGFAVLSGRRLGPRAALCH